MDEASLGGRDRQHRRQVATLGNCREVVTKSMIHFTCQCGALQVGMVLGEGWPRVPARSIMPCQDVPRRRHSGRATGPRLCGAHTAPGPLTMVPCLLVLALLHLVCQTRGVVHVIVRLLRQLGHILLYPLSSHTITET